MMRWVYPLSSGGFLLMFLLHAFTGVEWFSSAVRSENPSAPVEDGFSSGRSRSFFFFSSGGYSGGK